MSKTIQEMLDAEIAKDQAAHKKEQNSWHPSALGSCLTGVYLSRLGVPADEEFDERTLRVFSVGKFFEEWFVGLIERNGGAKITRQVRVESKEYNVSGYADIVADFEDGRSFPYEIKTMHSKGFHYLKKSGPKEHHQQQLWTYLWLLNKPEGRLVYFSKDDLCINEYIVFLDDEDLKASVINQFDTLQLAWNLKLPPPVTFDSKDWRAQYCRWHKQCTSQANYLKVGNTN